MIASALGKVVSAAVIVCRTVDEVLEAMETRHAEWSESQLIEQFAARTTGPDQATIADTIEQVRAAAMASAGVVDLCPPVEPGDIVRVSDGCPIALAPSAIRYTTSSHLRREVDLVEWATIPVMARHQRHDPATENLEGLDSSQADAIVTMLGTTRPVGTVVGSAGAGKTRMLAAAVDSWRHAGIRVFGVGPSASSARQLADGAGTTADTLHKLVYEHHLIVSERTDAKQLYVGATRGRTVNHIHVSPPAFDGEHHGPNLPTAEWSPTEAVMASLQREGPRTAALERRRRLRDDATDGRSNRATAALTAQQRLAALRISRSTTGRTL